MSAVDVAALAAILRRAAKAEILPRFRRLDEGMVRQKSEAIDLVTEADEAAERHIAAEVRNLLPEALFVGEESVARDPGLLAALDDAALAVVVDPVDGTANFAAGLPLFAVMAAVVRNGETVAGIIYDPMGDDFALAEKGGGAYMRFPDQGRDMRLQVATPPDLAQMVGCVSTAFMPAARKPQILANLAKVRVAANYRVAGHAYRLLAAGHIHFAAFNKLMPWDHLAGTLIVEEAGGYAARFDGSRYLPVHRAGGLLVAANEDCWKQLRSEVFTF
ncbi:inositol monophosphatase family protein [Devosia sp.]|uniref:inositol monophosphatase family protein n=1 Tax=Devosia sp. TaxID=1871048 RepID=UPI002EFECBA6